jgi:hypothetical protein
MAAAAPLLAQVNLACVKMVAENVRRSTQYAAEDSCWTTRYQVM